MKKKQVLNTLGAMMAALVLGTAHAADPIIDLNAIDPTVDPCQDFYHYACGNWIKNFALPADRPSYNRQSDGLAVANETQLGAILDSYAKGDFKVSAKYAQKLGAYYASCMNTSAIAAESQSFIAGQLAAIDKIQSVKDLGSVAARLQLAGVSAFFNYYSTPDMDDSSQTIAQLDQGGVSFQDRGYYFNTDAKSLEILQKFKAHVAAILTLAGENVDQVAQDADTVLAYETSLEQKALAIEDMQDSTQLHHPMDLAGIVALAPNFGWTDYFSALGVVPGKTNVTNPDFFKAFDAIIATSPLSATKTYLKWQVLNRYASELSTDFHNEDFAFWKKYLAGQSEDKPRWKYCTNLTAGAMRDALAEAYVSSFANPAAIKANAENMIVTIKTMFGANLDNLDWLDDATRAQAKLKLSKVTDKVGYPDHWLNIDDLQVSATSFLANVQASSIFGSRVDLKKIGKATDRTLWDMAPWEINAYYNPPSNEMVFPIGALLPPIFDMNASMGANFGSIGGGWMGHELTHGFDSDGHQYDGDGNLKNWWTQATLDRFNERTQCLVDQGSKYEILPGLFVNGKQTLTENIADQGGVKMGYLAFRKLTEGKPAAPNVGSFNERQQYWVAYAQSWCTKETDEKIRLTVTTDVHPPAEFRTNVVLFNRPEFAEDFGCKPGSRMVPAQRCSVW